ncbi:Uncharacterised protein [Burkholderia pseudomallei]|nr:Uncharacterised protein [Burkholderia pseudomallei]CAJ9801650.1 Uncharacterised protein [Burkholderia pseudomallei]
MKAKLILGTCAAALILQGCGTVSHNNYPSASSATPSTASDNSTSNEIPSMNSRLKFLRATSSADKIAIYKEFSTPESGTGDSSISWLVSEDEKGKIAETCGGHAPLSGSAATGQSPQRVLPLIFAVPLADATGWVISQVGTWVVTQVDDKMQAELATYSRTSSTSSGAFDFYDSLGLDTGSRGGDTKTMCFHLTQLTPSNPNDPKSNQIVAVDFVGKVDYDFGSPEVVKISPVRLYVKSIAVNTNDGSASLNIKMMMDAVWMDSNRGNSQAAVIDTSLVTETIKQSALPFYKTYASPAATSTVQSEAREIAVPLPPWDAGSRNSRHNRANATLTVLEIGNVPWLLKNAAALLHNNKDGVAADIVAEAKKEATAKIAPSASK